MKRLVLSIALTASLFNIASADLVDAIAAKVDQEIILVSEVLGLIGGEMENIRKAARTQEEYEQKTDALMMGTLKEIIENKILYREALRASIVVSDDAVEKDIDDFRDKFENTENFMAYLNDAGVTLNSYREQTRKRMMANYMMGTKLRDLELAVVINEKDVTNYFNENMEKYSRPERVYVRQINLQVRRNTPEREKAKTRLEGIRDEIHDGADFNEMAKRHSQAVGAEDGGIIGWNAAGDLVPVLEEAAFSLDPGEVSDIVGTPFGLHLLKVDKREAASDVELSEVRGQIEPALRRNKATDRYEKWLNDLRKRSNVRIYL